jgi:hypothetical protein
VQAGGVWLQVREWLPDELRDQSASNRNRVQVELKGSTVVSYVYQTAMVRHAAAVVIAVLALLLVGLAKYIQVHQ